MPNLGQSKICEQKNSERRMWSGIAETIPDVVQIGVVKRTESRKIIIKKKNPPKMGECVNGPNVYC